METQHETVKENFTNAHHCQTNSLLAEPCDSKATEIPDFHSEMRGKLATQGNDAPEDTLKPEPEIDVNGIVAQKKGFKYFDVENHAYRDVKHLKERSLISVRFKTKDTCSWKCCRCMPLSSAKLMNDDILNSGLIDVLSLPLANRSQPWTRLVCDFTYVWQQGIPGRYGSFARDVLSHSRITKAIRAQMESEGIPEKTEGSPTDDSGQRKPYVEKVERALTRMSAHVSKAVIRMAAWFLYKMFRSLLSSIVVHRGQLYVIKRTCKTDRPVLFLPVHRSHLDYMLLSFVLFNFDVKIPYVAAGDNLILPFFGTLMRCLGGFFIRRKMEEQGDKRDHIYRAVLHVYVEQLLARGETMEFFIEGGRSRSGKILTPKTGLLSIVVDTYLQGIIEDVSVVPVAISYEKLPEVNFTGEQLGLPKKSETFWGTVVRALGVLFGFYGSVRIDFAQPFSLKEFVTAHRARTPSEGQQMTRTSSESFITSGDGTDRALVYDLANHVARDQTRVHSISSTQLVAWALLHAHREGADMKDLVETVEALRGAIASKGHGFGFVGLSEDVTRYALQLLGRDLVKVKDDGGKEFVAVATKLPEVVELSYYANAVNMVFSLEGALASSIYSVSGMRDVNWTRADRMVEFDANEVLDDTVQLLGLLRHEFAFTPVCQDLETVASSAFHSLYNSRLICRPEEELEQDSHHHVHRMWDNSFEENQSGRDIYGLKLENVKQFLSLKSSIGPILECYHIVSCHLHKLIGKDAIESEFIQGLHDHLKKRAEEGQAEYEESACLDTLRNCIRSLQDSGILGSYNACGLGMIGLLGDYQSPVVLNQFASHLGSYRN